MFKRKNFSQILVLFFAVTFSSQAMACGKPVTAASGSHTGKPSGNVEQDILYYVNKYRKSKGRPALQMSDVVSAEARGHSRAMANGRTAFGHDGFESRIDDISKKLGRVNAAAENVAYGNLDAEAVVDGWIKSPGHRKNMLGNFNLIGIGTAKGKGNIIYFTQIFVNKPVAAKQ